MSWRYDPELDEVFTDPDERRMAAILTSVQAPQVEPDPAFRSQLRRQLMAQAWNRAEPRLPWWRRLSAPAPAAWGMATVGAILIAAAVYLSVHPGPGGQTIVVSYNLDSTQPVAAVRPLDVSFSQPMDRSTVEQAVQITPATAVTYTWVSDREVKIAPVAGSFAPNTQYTVALQPNVAKSQTGSVVTDTKPAVFTVAPTPTPTPSITPSPSPSASPITTEVVGPAAPARAAWLPSGSLVYAGSSGQLVEQAPGGTPVTVPLPAAVQAIAIRPDAAAALVLAGPAVSEVSLATHAVTPVAAPAQVLAIAYDAAGKPWTATATEAGPAAGGPRHKLDQPATAAWLSPRAGQLVYRSAQGLRSVDLANGKETAWPAAVATSATVVGWSPDDKRVLYTTTDGLFAADPTGAAAVQVAREAAVAADWSAAGYIVYSTSSSTVMVAADGTGARPLAASGFQALSWAPSGTRFAYFLPGASAAAGTMNIATLSAPPPPAATSAEDAAKTVAAFMQARVAGQADAAKAQLDSAGQAAYGAATPLLYTGDPRLERWFTVATLPEAQDVRVDARLVLADAKGRDVAQLDELLTVTRDAGGRTLVHAASATAARPYGKGPEVIGVQSGATSISVQFDSDLAPATAGTSVVLLDASGKQVATGTLSGTRDVVVTPPAGLAAGTYRLQVLTGLKDKDGRASAAGFALDLSLGGDAPAHAPAPSPSPSPAPSPST